MENKIENKIKKGDIIKLYKDEEDQYIVISTLNEETEEYLLIHPQKEEISNKEMLLIKKQGEEFEYITDSTKVESIVTKMLEEENNI